MIESLSEKRFKTAGARILRTKKLPKDFFVSRDNDISNSNSVHTSKRKSSKHCPNIFEFTFMGKEGLSLQKSKSGILNSSK
jgi:hypothetical protein